MSGAVVSADMPVARMLVVPEGDGCRGCPLYREPTHDHDPYCAEDGHGTGREMPDDHDERRAPEWCPLRAGCVVLHFIEGQLTPPPKATLKVKR